MISVKFPVWIEKIPSHQVPPIMSGSPLRSMLHLLDFILQCSEPQLRNPDSNGSLPKIAEIMECLD